MSVLMTELAAAREVTAGLLTELGLDAYLFEIEPRDDLWELKMDCAVNAEDTWETVNFTVPKAMLLNSPSDDAIHQRILSEWRDHLGDCKLR
jgi:hypothetical protein